MEQGDSTFHTKYYPEISKAKRLLIENRFEAFTFQKRFLGILGVRILTKELMISIFSIGSLRCTQEKE